VSFDDRIRQSLEDRAARAEVSDDAWAAISARTGPRRRPRFGLVLAGAALPVAAALAVVFAVSGDDGGPEVVTEAGPASGSDGATDDGFKSTAPAYDHSHPVGLEKAGSGEVVAVSFDGSALIVSDFDGRVDETGCEGMAEPILLRAPFDGGRREPIGIDPDGKPLSGSVVRGADGRVAILDICEGFLGRVLVGHENPDGTFRDLTEFHHPLAGEAFVTGWSASGNELLAIAWVQDGEPGRAAVRLNVTTGEMQEIIRDEIHDVGELWDGTIVVGGDGASVRALDTRGGNRWTNPGELFAISPDRRTVAVVGPDRVDLLTSDGHRERLLGIAPHERVRELHWSESGEALAYVTEPSDTTVNPVDNEVHVITVGAADRAMISAEPGRYGGLAFSLDGGLLAFTRYEYDPDFSPEALVSRFAQR
jgi:hypothetical protein